MGGVSTLEQNEPFRLRGCIRWWRLCAKFCMGATLLVWLLRTFVAQSHLLVAPLVYMPAIWIGPGLLLVAIPGWWWGRRLLLGCAVVAVVFHGSLIGWSSLPSGEKLGSPLRVAFVNRGDQDPVKWMEWIGKQKADLIGLTDVRGRDSTGLGVGLPVVGGLPYLMRIGEHALASRYPFKGTQVIRPDLPSGSSVRVKYLPAARFEVDAPAGPVAVYVVHIRSPRDALSKYRSLKMWRWTIMGVPVHVSPSVTIDSYWQEQELVIEGLLKRIEAETLPTIVLGDWNVPDVGPRYRRLTRSLQDAHRQAGKGFGYTFPGDLAHWAALGQPWMRIDYVLTDRQHWMIDDCRVQSGAEAGRSQHRAIIVELRRPLQRF
jgi:endonuclease/exonuclease/phosphatase family metal-dependent hydrolase